MSDEQWYVVIDAVSGETRSFGTVVANPLPVGLLVAQITAVEMEAISHGEAEWSAELRCVVPVLNPAE